MKKFLFSSRTLTAATAVAAIALAVGPATASASTSSTPLFATLQGTSVLGTPVPVLGTQGFTITLPVGDDVVPGETLVWEAIDVTVESSVKVGNLQVANVYVDPHMLK